MSQEQQAKLNFYKVYTGSTTNVIKSVLLGKVDAGVVFITELDMEPVEVREQLRAIIVTEKVAPHPLCAHSRVPRQAREAVRKAVLAIAAAPDGGELLKKIRMPSPVAADYDQDYRPLEQINIRELSNWGE